MPGARSAPELLSTRLGIIRITGQAAARFRREKHQQFRRGKPVGRSGFYADLEIVDRIARGLPETAVDWPMIKIEAFEHALNLRFLRPAQKNLCLRPMAAQVGFAFDPPTKFFRLTNGVLVEQTQELLQKWDARARRLHPRMEITGEGLMLGAGTMLAGMGRDERGRPRLALDDEPRALALLATAYERPVEAYVLAKMRRATELWNEGEKALAHIHLSFTGLPPCDGEDQMLRLFLAEECLAAGVTPVELIQAQGFDPVSLALSKYSADQPRVPAGSGRASGQWTSDGNTSEAQPPPTATPATSNNVQVA